MLGLLGLIILPDILQGRHDSNVFCIASVIRGHLTSGWWEDSPGARVDNGCSEALWDNDFVLNENQTEPA